MCGYIYIYRERERERERDTTYVCIYIYIYIYTHIIFSPHALDGDHRGLQSTESFMSAQVATTWNICVTFTLNLPWCLKGRSIKRIVF